MSWTSNAQDIANSGKSGRELVEMCDEYTAAKKRSNNAAEMNDIEAGRRILRAAAERLGY